MYSHDYAFVYTPAMPSVELSIGLTGGRILATLPAIVDSGADVTLIPLRYLRQCVLCQLKGNSYAALSV